MTDDQLKEFLSWAPLKNSPKRTIDEVIRIIPQLVPYRRAIPKQCYNNAYRFISDNTSSPYKYVLGYYFLNGSIPIEHAWVKIGKKHFDVTLKSISGDCFYVELESLALDELYEFVAVHKYPPSMFDLAVSHL